MATISKRKDRFQVRIRRKDASPLTRSFARLQDAKEWATLMEHRADRGELGPDKKELERITLAKLVERYREEVLPTKRGASQVERYMLNAFLRHPICKKRLCDLTTADFASYRDERLKEIASGSLKRQLTPLRNMFTVAQREWDIPLRNNPLSGLSLRAQDNKRERRLQEGELQRLMGALAQTRNPFVAPIICLALATAMRRGEILALEHRDIDLAKQVLTIRQAKNGHSRTIPLTHEAIEALKTVHVARKPGLVFDIKAASLREAWEWATKRAELEDLHFHDLRHEAISRLFELGLTVPEVASVSGHRTLSQLMRYAHAQHQSIRAKLGVGPALQAAA